MSATMRPNAAGASAQDSLSVKAAKAAGLLVPSPRDELLMPRIVPMNPTHAAVDAMVARLFSPRVICI